MRWPAWWPLAAVFAWFAATIGARTLAVPDEGRYAGVAWGMVSSGDWLVPRLDGLPYFHKPPLFYWIAALAMHWAGPVEWAARIAPLLGAMAGATAVYLFARLWSGEARARLALLACATQVLVFIGAQFANLDMLVAGCITVTVLALAHAALRAEEGGSRPALAIAYLFAALGVLAKGLIGVVLPGLVIVAWLVLQRRWRTLPRLAWWPGLLLFLLVAAPWFVLMQRRFAEFSWYFFYVQQFARYTQGGFNNRQPAYFYPVVLLALAFPWSLWILRSLRAEAGTPRPDPDRSIRALCWTWLVAVAVFFSVPQSKLVGYIFPAAFPLALLAADALAASPSPRLRAWWRASAAIAVAACLGTVVFGMVRPFHSTRALGIALRQRDAGDRVVFVRHYWFDVPVYAGLRRPVAVLDDWSEAHARQHDDWRRELADAGHFDPAAARALLVPASDAARLLCTDTPTWVVGDAGSAQQWPMLAGAPVLASQGDVRLWRLDAGSTLASRAGCPPAGELELSARP